MKKIKFHNASIVIVKLHEYGHYQLSGLNTSVITTDSEIWDNADDDEQRQKSMNAKRTAYNLLRANR